VVSQDIVKFFFAQSLKDEKVAAWFLLFSIVSSGMFHASSALLPSTTVMQLWLVSYSYYNKNFVKEAIYWGLLSVLATGWPFCALLWVPLGVHVLWVRARKGYTMFIHTIMETIITAICIQLAVCIIDYSRYGQNKLVFPTWNILLYNLTSGGDELYGVEPISYYLKNLFLNFNFVSILGLIISPLILLFRKKSIFYLFPMFIWIIIVFPRPHKEERFLYPIYPSICYSASLFMKEILNTRKKKILLFLIIGNMVFFYVLFSVLRSTALSVYYMAPIHVYHFFYYYALDRHHPSTNNTLCVAGEWYRFPSSYFLPFNTKLSFLRSSFKGQLPQPFQANTGPFNDMNREEISRYGVIEDCDYLIDFANQYEEDEWEKIASFPFLNAEKTSFLSRIIYLSPIMEIWNKEKMPQFESYSLFRKISKKNTI